MRVFLQLDEPLRKAVRNRDMQLASGYGVFRSTTRPPRRINDVMAVPVAVVLIDLHDHSHFEHSHFEKHFPPDGPVAITALVRSSHPIDMEYAQFKANKICILWPLNGHTMSLPQTPAP
jgi:hypothetical protein